MNDTIQHISVVWTLSRSASTHGEYWVFIIKIIKVWPKVICIFNTKPYQNPILTNVVALRSIDGYVLLYPVEEDGAPCTSDIQIGHEDHQAPPDCM